jgi:hypothetical protein
MGGATNDIRYASEIPTVLAWDPSYASDDFEKAKRIALSTNQYKYDQNCIKARRHKEIVEADMSRRGFAKVNKISWQAHNNRNDNGSPADVVFEDHHVGGNSVKDGSDIVLNSGIEDFVVATGCPKRVDLFQHLATVEFDNLLYRVIHDCINELSVGQTWTQDREEGYGKYSITRLSDNQFKIKFVNTYKIFTTAELLSWTTVSKKGIQKPIALRLRRVFGDYYQGRKQFYRSERDALYKVLYPQLETICKQIVASDGDKLCRTGGFTEKPHYVSDLRKDQVYFVPSKSEMLNKIKLSIIDKAEDKTFGAGFELRCEIKLADLTKCATLDFYVCYNGGTFKGNPVIKIQNFQGKENLWTRIV